MKEYLFKYNNQYTLVELSKEDAESNPWQYIAVPEWGNYAYNNNTGVYFLKDAARYSQSSLVWQRESLNDKIATAEVARQKTASQWDLQVGGDHYKSMKIQPAKFALENKLDYCQANAIKYICRHASKNGKQDLEKAKHYIDLLIEHYYGGDDEI